MAATGLNEFYEARRKECRFMERAAVSQPHAGKPCSSCGQCGCCSSCARYHSYSYGTPYTEAYRPGGVKEALGGRSVVTSASPHRGFSCEMHKQTRSERIHEYDRLMASTEKPGIRYLTGVLPKRYNDAFLYYHAWVVNNMSISVPVSYLYNRNDKFEVFLRRCLTQEQFERIRGYERCIADDGKKLKKAFCYYVISDRAIFITENPPKSILLNICLSQLTHCEIIDDFPDFLDGNLTDLCTHVQITYHTPSEEKEESSNNENKQTNAPNEKPRRRSRQKSSPQVSTSASAYQSANSTKPESHEPKARKNIFANIFSKEKSRKTNTSDKVGSESANAGADAGKLAGENSTTQDKPAVKKDEENYDDDIPEDAFHFVSEEEAKLRQKQKGKSLRKKNEFVLDVYFLTNITPVCLLTKISWNNYLISSTMAKERLFVELMAETRKNLTNFENVQLIAQHFDLTMRELLMTAQAADLDSAKLDTYAKLAARFDLYAYHSFAVRRLFWKSDASFAELVSCAEIFANETSLGVAPSKNLFKAAWNKKLHELRIECLALTIHLLATFFNETEILRSRTCILEESKNGVLKPLLAILYNAIAYTTRCLYFDKRFKRGQRDQQQKLSDTEELFEDLMTASATLIYEIILSAQAIVHPTESPHLFNVRYLVTQFEQIPQAAEAIYGLAYDTIQSLAFIPETPSQISLNHPATPIEEADTAVAEQQQQPPIISPGKAVQVYRQLFILDVLTYNSSVFLRGLREKLTEEFKYFTNMQTVMARVPADYPVGVLLLHTFELVRHRVLIKQAYENVDIREQASLNLVKV